MTVYEAALSDSPGTARFSEEIGSQEESSLVGFGQDDDGRPVEYFAVPVLTLDQTAPDWVALVKIAAQHAEYSIIKGGARVLATHPFVALELGANPKEVYDLLTERFCTVTLLSRWLGEEPPPPSLEALRRNGEYFFLAYPAK